MSKPHISVITIIQNKLLEGNTKITDQQVRDAEKEFKEMCKMCKVTGREEEVSAIDEMIDSLKRDQTRSAKSHAGRVPQAITFCETRLKTNASEEKGYAQIHGSGNRKATPAASHERPREPAPDYDDVRKPSSRQVAQFPNSHRSKTGTPNHEEFAKMEKNKDVSERLRKDNPSITDLSDANRPTKLAEKYTELYDNEWTDGLEELQKICHLADGDAVACLLQILKETYKRNSREAKDQFEEIERAIKGIMTRSKASMDGDKENIKGDTSSLRQYCKSLAKLSVGRLQQTFEGNDLRDFLDKYTRQAESQLPNVVAYTRKCVELTWLMCVQDPLVHLDAGEEYQHFQANMYKAFTKHGDSVDYYVWPALFLHEGGPLLAKGVAQGM